MSWELSARQRVKEGKVPAADQTFLSALSPRRPGVGGLTETPELQNAAKGLFLGVTDVNWVTVPVSEVILKCKEHFHFPSLLISQLNSFSEVQNSFFRGGLW